MQSPESWLQLTSVGMDMLGLDVFSKRKLRNQFLYIRKMMPIHDVSLHHHKCEVALNNMFLYKSIFMFMYTQNTLVMRNM